jgi:hypothetical protein
MEVGKNNWTINIVCWGRIYYRKTHWQNKSTCSLGDNRIIDIHNFQNLDVC